MDDFVGVHIFQGTDDLDDVALDLKLVKPFSTAEDLVEGLIDTQF